ncbi:MAG: hypothetical protein M3Q73_02895 [bacterium]|nr:hypothetical protein [bacterium]
MKNKFPIIIALVAVLIIVGATLSIKQTPDTESEVNTIPAYIAIEHADAESKVYKISGADKILLLTIERSPENPTKPSATLSLDGNTLIYADHWGNLNSFSIQTGSTTIIKKGVSDREEQTPPPKISEFYVARKAQFSPDGKKIAVNWSGWEWSGIGLMNADGTNYQEIRSRCWINDFTWAPDSQTFAIGAVWDGMGGAPACLHIGNINTIGQPNDHKELLIPEGLGPRDETEADSYYKDVHFPQFSPAGDTIAFSYVHNMSTTSIGNPAFVPKVDLFTINKDGSGLNRVTIDDIGIVKTLWKDDSTLIYGRDGQGIAGIYSVTTNTSSTTRLTTSSHDRYEAVSISPSGTFLIYQALPKAESAALMHLYNFETKESTELGTNMSFVGWVR